MSAKAGRGPSWSARLAILAAWALALWLAWIAGEALWYGDIELHNDDAPSGRQIVIWFVEPLTFAWEVAWRLLGAAAIAWIAWVQWHEPGKTGGKTAAEPRGSPVGNAIAWVLLVPIALLVLLTLVVMGLELFK